MENINPNNNITLIKQKGLLIASFFAVIIIHHVTYGLSTLVPTNVSWLMTALHDWGTHYLGWAFYKNEPWGFPLGNISRYYYPIGTNVGFTDSIPLFAIFFKLFAPLLPDDFQYFGLWLFLCYALTAFFTIKILRLFNLSQLNIFIAVIFVTANPVLVYRGLHPALCAQWLLLASLYLYFHSKSSNKSTLLLRYQLILLLLAALINPYMCFMVLGFVFILPVKLCFFDKKISWKYFCGYIVVSILLLLACWYIVGMVTIGKKEDLAVTGAYGLYSLNLNSLYNSWGFSAWLPQQKIVSWHQYEGFMYLGIGILLLFSFYIVYVLYSFVFKKKRPGALQGISNKYLLPLYCIAILYSLFSITHIVSLNDKVLFKIPIPSLFVSFGEVLRASARFFWLPYYLILFFIVIVVSKIRMQPLLRLAILTSALLIQVYDIKPLLTGRNLTYGSYEPPLNKEWKTIIKQFDEVVFYPPFNAHYLSNLDYQYFCFLAAKEKKAINIGYVARANNNSASFLTDSLNKALAAGNISPKVLYVTTSAYLQYFAQPLQTQACQLNSLDNYFYLFKKDIPNKGLLKLAQELNEKNKSTIDSGLIQFGQKKLFMEVKRPALQNTEKIVSFVERFSEAESFMSIDGWAFIESAATNKGDSIFIALENDQHYYIAKARTIARPDITGAYSKPLDDAGFGGILYKDSVAKGYYDLVIAIKSKNKDWVTQKTDKVVKAGISEFSNPEKLSLLPSLSDIFYGVDIFKTDGNFFQVAGWAAFKNQHVSGSEISLLLINKEQMYSVMTDVVKRPDVTVAKKLDSDNSGFSAKILKLSIAPGHYQIGVMINDTKTKTKGYILVGKEIDIVQ